VRAACKAPSSELKQSLGAVHIPLGYELDVLSSAQISSSLRKSIWTLYEVNMKKLLIPSSFGWDPSDKKKELFHPDSRYILIRPASGALVAFASFRFDVEPDVDDVDEDIVYLYELQVASASRKLGLGRLLMQSVETIAARWKMRKVLLTALLENIDTLKFYARMQYILDSTSMISIHTLFPALDPPATTSASVTASHFTDTDEQEDEEDEPVDYLLLSKLMHT